MARSYGGPPAFLDRAQYFDLSFPELGAEDMGGEKHGVADHPLRQRPLLRGEFFFSFHQKLVLSRKATRLSLWAFRLCLAVVVAQ